MCVRCLCITSLVSLVHSETARTRALNRKIDTVRDLLGQDIDLLRMDMLSIKPDLLEEVQRLLGDMPLVDSRQSPAPHGGDPVPQGGWETCQQQIILEQDARRGLEEKFETLATSIGGTPTPYPTTELDEENRLRRLEHTIHILARAFASLKKKAFKHSGDIELLNEDMKRVENQLES
jgi:hypothetical protein